MIINYAKLCKRLIVRKKFLYQILFSVFVSFFYSCSPKVEFKGEFGFLPENPRQGSELTILYKPSKPVFEKDDEVYAKAYVFEKDIKYATDVRMIYGDGGWTGKLSLPKVGYGVLLSFTSGEAEDNNKGLGYLVQLSDNDGKKFAEFDAAYAQALSGWGRSYLDLTPELDVVLKKFEDAVAANPPLLKKYGGSIVGLSRRISPENFERTFKTTQEYIESNFTSTEEEIEFLYSYYMQSNEVQKAETYKKMMEEKYPQANMLQTLLAGKLRAAKEIGEKLKIADSFIETFPASPRVTEIHSAIITEHRNAKRFGDAYEYAKKYAEKVNIYSIYSLLSIMEKEEAEAALALQVAALADQLYRQRITEPEKYKTIEETPKNFTDELNYYYGLIRFVTAKYYDNQNNLPAALEAVKEAYKLTKGEDASPNALYAELLLKSGNYKEAVEKTSLFISSGKANSRIKEIYRESVMNTVGSEIAAEDGLAELEATAREKSKAKLLKKMISQPSPDFTLTNLKGESVSLSALRGKIIVIDFWATWCGPCVNSFPGMQRAVDQYANDPEVEFLFINSWENVKDKEENARKFITEKKYSFNVLMDTENKVITSYKVSGIPTKFILDKEGNTRFISVGYNGNNDELVEELGIMISALK